MAELSIEEYKKLAEEFLEKYKKLDYIASGQRATDMLNKTDPMRVNPGLEEIFGNPEAELAQEELIKEYQSKGLDASRVAYLNDTTPPDTLNTEAFNKAEQAYEDRMADIAAREPSQSELNRAYGKRDSLNNFEDEQILKDQSKENWWQGENFDGTPEQKAALLNEIEKQNNLPKGSFSKLGAILDPISEGLELALKAAGLGKIANWWIKAEAANFLAALMRAGVSAQTQAGMAQSKILMGDETGAKNVEAKMMESAKQSFESQMKFSPSMWLEKKYAQSNFGKGKTPTEQMYSKVVQALNLGGK